MDKEALEMQIKTIEDQMAQADFWNDKDKAQAAIRELQELKEKREGAGKYDKGNAVMSILSGAGGDDAEDFSNILFEMYRKFVAKKGWQASIVHENKNDHGGYRNITFEIIGKGTYGTLRNESGVHRLVRISPFNAKQMRHTSFSLVEVIPKFEKVLETDIPPDQVRVELSKAGGPGGQNVNKRETAVRLVHIPTNISVHVASERSQAQNKEKAFALLKGKLFKKEEEDQKKKAAGMAVSSTTDIEWGSQIRSYVFHPYKMVKDHRTNVEVHNVDKVLDGDLDEFIEAEKEL
ncbi:PCRF domain-containing protein [Candidatus Parcubacteria bacterium]|nr:PCRF domain-containing protein [Candidatus Parcubacteria bacterium]